MLVIVREESTSQGTSHLRVNKYIVAIHMYTYIYIYIERERERYGCTLYLTAMGVCVAYSSSPSLPPIVTPLFSHQLQPQSPSIVTTTYSHQLEAQSPCNGHPYV